MTDIAALARPLAAITTATVDVQVLRIGAKQMTLAVFRQLIRDDKITGPMWGTVEYHHKEFGCGAKAHKHVVWQDGSELRHGVALYPDERALRSMRLDAGRLTDEVDRREALAGLDRFEAQLRALWPAVLALPQLFIAV